MDSQRAVGESLESPQPVAQTTTSRLARSAGLIGLATMTSRLLGLVREQVLAYYFGAGNAMDAFNVAFRLPNLVRDLFAEGAMSAAFVPTFTRYLTLRDPSEAWRLGNLVVNALAVVTGAIAILGIVFAWPLTMLYAGDYARVPGKIELTVVLTRLMFPFLPLVAVAAAFMGMLNSLHRFFVPAVSPAMFNVGTILCAVILVPVMPRLGLHPVTAIAVGALVGGLGQLALQWPALRREGFRYRAVLDPADEGLRQILVLMGPGTIGLAATQVNLLVNTLLATSQGTGAVSWLSYAFRLMYLPIGLFGVSIATAAIPSISRHAAREEMGGMRETISRGLRLMLMLNVPATIGLIALASPIIGLIFERGRFTAADTMATAAALVFYAPGLIGYSAVKIAVPTFYALGDSRTPVLVSIASMLTNAILNVALVQVMGYRGLALGTALAALLNAVMLLWLLGARLDGVEGKRIALTGLKILVASVVMGVVAIAIEVALGGVIPGGSLAARLIRVGTAIGVAMATLALAARILRIEEFEEAVAQLKARVFPRPIHPECGVKSVHRGERGAPRE
ncbi:MAG: murein biosynthesis integral membrane protein MurJ [Acidobacteria bacterium]|nr:murein biosynthesis integral membrane protein MurJ [Acidobacteriota bacterium]